MTTFIGQNGAHISSKQWKQTEMFCKLPNKPEWYDLNLKQDVKEVLLYCKYSYYRGEWSNIAVISVDLHWP